VVSEEWREYTQRLNGKQTQQMQALTQKAINERVPIMQPEAMSLVEQVIRIKKPKNILEIGTAVGWSAIHMAGASGHKAKITTVEREPKMIEAAKKNLKDFQLEQLIEVVEGHVLELDDELKNRGLYDMILIDAGKGHYQEYFTRFLPMLSSDGIIICDNVYFRGYSIDPSLAPKRLKRLAQKMNDFNQWLSNHPNFDTVFVPVGDGLSISTRKL
jgi:predicted O-methyltransferase YrrM